MCLACVAPLAAQRGQGRQGGAPSARASAPVDLTGTWVSVVTEDWRWRMRTPPKGDYASLPLTDAAIKVADSWDPARDAAAGEQCRPTVAPRSCACPAASVSAGTTTPRSKIETEAGTQTRCVRVWLGVQPRRAELARRLSGQLAGSRRRWTSRRRSSARRLAARRDDEPASRVPAENGVPYSANARLTEYINRVNEPNGDSWLIVTTMVEDPQNLNARFVTSSHFKKIPDGSAWKPTPCST